MIPLITAMTSINKPHTDNIFDFKKFVEWRTRPLPVGKHFCYETKKSGGSGKIIGSFNVNHVMKYKSVDAIPNHLIEFGCISREFLAEYSGGKPLYANFIWLQTRFDVPLELCDFFTVRNDSFGEKYNVMTRPPQSWCFVVRR